ncbi:restriction endonuclease [Streptomyces sp. SID13666]|uniref:restriction endonuclease n=1 Tax=unclassified Streptomyces TaxID=2593676 RepID=UPI0013BF5889|nr:MULTISPECIES: restriction endonuclease [unclassified Streptomyces]NEA56636.1 restriction endonuclease [Streptomyces sp. SID13666]NEA73080.1 restriction endonuclease [Streptomyces sp. SID13588]
MPKRKGRRNKAQRQRELRQRATISLAGLAAVLLMLWQSPWLLLGITGTGAVAVVTWRLWKSHRRERNGDRSWREHNRHMELERSMAAIDAMTWQDFEHYVAELCRRDGCSDVIVVGGSGDLAADVLGYMPDGRRLVVQVKHYAPDRKVPSGDMQKFVGMAFHEHRADVALFVATCEYGKAARELAVKHRIVALNRNLFGSWNSGAPLESLLPLSGAGGGVPRRRHPVRKRHEGSS